MHFSKNAFLIVHCLMVNIKDLIAPFIHAKEIHCKCMNEKKKSTVKLL
ncbi:hypothetical protein HMPREF9446_01789 [Bacteroides fluxus YIT 12057]|uniref:Uncharacterized protein n=1 Tax=Bacteroides fluxus YIT 12057 TaxID=763034 RepID=F3PSS6_9BACE|nr:hypothetical protein HMPREF9446_01789 [Bacteroides fluxus YIT 12057]